VVSQMTPCGERGKRGKRNGPPKEEGEKKKKMRRFAGSRYPNRESAERRNLSNLKRQKKHRPGQTIADKSKLSTERKTGKKKKKKTRENIHIQKNNNHHRIRKANREVQKNYPKLLLVRWKHERKNNND